MRSIFERSTVCAIFFLSALGTTVRAAENFKINSFRLPMVVQDGQGTRNPARGASLNFPSTLLLGKEGGLVVEGDANTTLSILGPACVWIHEYNDKLEVKVEYGDVHLKSTDTALLFESGDIHFEGQNLEFYLEKAPQTKILRLRNVGGTLLLHQREINAGESYAVSTTGLEWYSTVTNEEIKDVASRHQINRVGKVEESENEKNSDPNLSRILEWAFIPGISELLPSSGNYSQNQIGYGTILRWVSHHYFSLPEHPERVHYLNAPALRYGASLSFLAARLTVPTIDLGSSAIVGIEPFVGFSYQGTSLDAFVAAQYFHNSAITYTSAWPIAVGLDLAQRFDLKSLTASETGLTLGLRYEVKSLTTAYLGGITPFSPATFLWNFFGLYVALSFRF